MVFMAHKIFNLLTVHFQLLQFGFIITIFLVNPNEVSFTQPMSHKITMINVEYVSHFRRERLFELIKIIEIFQFNLICFSIHFSCRFHNFVYPGWDSVRDLRTTYRRPPVLDNRFLHCEFLQHNMPF